VLQAMVQMGVLVPTGDLTAVRRTAQFFLNSFEDRLAAQRLEKEEAAEEETPLGFKTPLTKEEKAEKKKMRLAAIGEDLLSIAVDQPFRFPATFTFVVRAFSGDDDAHHLLTLETVVYRNSCCYLPICFV
jgi:hypothetical protein